METRGLRFLSLRFFCGTVHARFGVARFSHGSILQAPAPAPQLGLGFGPQWQTLHTPLRARRSSRPALVLRRHGTVAGHRPGSVGLDDPSCGHSVRLEGFVIMLLWMLLIWQRLDMDTPPCELHTAHKWRILQGELSDNGHPAQCMYVCALSIY
jgi:hypothetical protein